MSGMSMNTTKKAVEKYVYTYKQIFIFVQTFCTHMTIILASGNFFYCSSYNIREIKIGLKYRQCGFKTSIRYTHVTVSNLYILYSVHICTRSVVNVYLSDNKDKH